ncbi:MULTISPECIES: hypothetical protein [Flavobacteriaceae]|uniref:hypothetical protein n=1 Tax=Flavobacteriaceae TaxID=49546 RepID=UPI0014915AA0|nr:MULTISPECIES: hypothetical protein [Allomuricauda]MDC6365071.1 hypothetical protein [Muricauda sp. AC10]
MKKDKENFKTPEGYFDSFHERLMDKIQQEETALGETIIPKSDGFAVPDGYFANLTQDVLSKTIDGQKGKVIQLGAYKKLFYAVAATAAVFFLIFAPNWTAEPEIGFEDLARTEIDDYFDTAELDMSTYEIAEVVSLEDIELSDVMEVNLEAENILDYLDENVEDIEELNLDYSDYE